MEEGNDNNIKVNIEKIISRERKKKGNKVIYKILKNYVINLAIMENGN